MCQKLPPHRLISRRLLLRFSVRATLTSRPYDQEDSMSNSKVSTDAKSEYILGHSEREIARLKAQAAELDPITRRFLCEAGIVPGMRVLDVGSGAGDVAFLAAELVGATGEVVGVDLAPAAIEVARSRAAAHSLENVTFIEGNPASMSFDRPFDAVKTGPEKL